MGSTGMTLDTTHSAGMRIPTHRTVAARSVIIPANLHTRRVTWVRRRTWATLGHLIPLSRVPLAQMEVRQVEIVLVPRFRLGMLLATELVVVNQCRGKFIHLSIITENDIVLEVRIHVL